MRYLLNKLFNVGQRSDFPFVSALHLLLGCLLPGCLQSASAQEAADPAGVGARKLVKPLAENDRTMVPVENALLKTIEATTLSAEVAGRISAMNVSEGDFVQQDQNIGNVDDRAVRLQQQKSKVAMDVARLKLQSNIDLLLAEKRAAVAKNEYDRAEYANSRVANTYPPKEIDRLRLVYDTAMLEIERAKHDQELLELEVAMMENDQEISRELVERHRIIAPVSGLVVSVSKRLGEWVEPGTELLQIVNLDRLRIEGFIDASQASRSLLQRPAEVRLRSAEDEKVLQGKVVFLNPEVNPVNNQMRVYLEIENRDRTLHPGMRVQAAIATTDE